MGLLILDVGLLFPIGDLEEGRLGNIEMPPSMTSGIWR